MVTLGRRIIWVVANGDRVAPVTAIADASAAAADVERSSEAADGFERMLQASVGLAASELRASPEATLPIRGLLPCWPFGEPTVICWWVVVGASTVSWHWKVMTAPLLLLLLPFEEDAEWFEWMLARVPQGEQLGLHEPKAYPVAVLMAACCLLPLLLTAPPPMLPLLLLLPPLLPSKRRRGTPLKLLHGRVVEGEYFLVLDTEQHNKIKHKTRLLQSMQEKL